MEGSNYGEIVKILVDTTRLELVVVSTRKSSGFSATAPNLDAIASGQLPVQKPLSAAAAISAGFSSYDPTNSSGLVVENFVEISPLAIKNTILSGVLCIRQRAPSTIFTIQAYVDQETNCQGAIQGRLITHESLREIFSDRSDDRPTMRLAVCTSRDDRNLMFIMLSRATISDRQQELSARVCKAAMLLTDSGQSGIVMGGFGTNTRPRSFGSTSAPVPAIIVIPNRPSR